MPGNKLPFSEDPVPIDLTKLKNYSNNNHGKPAHPAVHMRHRDAELRTNSELHHVQLYFASCSNATGIEYGLHHITTQHMDTILVSTAAALDWSVLTQGGAPRSATLHFLRNHDNAG